MNTNLKNATSDLIQGFKSHHLWVTLGWNDVKSRYHRSRLGVLWASLSVLIFVSTLAPIYAKIMDVELREYMLHLFLGFIIWNYLSGIIMESSRVFINSANYLVSFRLSYFTLLFRVVWRNLIVLCYQLLALILLIVIFQQPVNTVWLVTPIALFLITANALWLGLIMSVLNTRFRDVGEVANNIIRLIFFATPVMWMPHIKPDLQAIAGINPFYHLIETFRSPLLTGEVNPGNWYVTAIICVFGWLIAFPVFARYRKRIAFWL